MKKLAVVASGWHYPSQFYEGIAEQILPKGWSMDLFCISHRDPSFAQGEKKGRKFEGDRAELDRRLYRKVLSVKEIEGLGWKYIIKPNTIGDLGSSNQWLEDHDYKEYDLLLFTHDDNLILSDMWFKDIIQDGSFKDWEILCNSLGMPPGSIRGSCEFFKPSLLEKMGGKFDLSEVTLDRTGHTTATDDITELYDWNNITCPLQRFVEEQKISVGFMSPSYRVSSYCIEGERGYISNTHGANTKIEDEGLKTLKDYGLL
jgi:hypothetical protein